MKQHVTIVQISAHFVEALAIHHVVSLADRIVHSKERILEPFSSERYSL